MEFCSRDCCLEYATEAPGSTINSLIGWQRRSNRSRKMAGIKNRSWKLSAFGVDSLALQDAPLPEPGPHELLVRVSAVSLNYKDKLIIDGTLIPNLGFPYVPASDAVGEVIAVGRDVTRF